MTSYIQKLNISACSKYSHFEDELIKQFSKTRNQLKTVIYLIIQIKVYFLAKKILYQIEYSDIRNVKFLYKQIDSFMSQHKLSNRRKITVAQ